MVANRCHHAADRLWSAMLIWWRCEGKEKLLLPAAQRLVRIQREMIAQLNGFHRQVETHLIVRSSWANALGAFAW
jgi:hypothetical protein